ncbi:hypothetical protein FC52_GL000775 [Lactobacillus pasteurii DSM 23907 = CRBIP 24.76]|nr:hypothetical protein FC52_GL000775 [Lactobacillus pasteurii DSM 23907 = CRBIP 24.76]
MSVIAVVNLLGILVSSLTLLTKKISKWLVALNELITIFYDLWKKIEHTKKPPITFGRDSRTTF